MRQDDGSYLITGEKIFITSGDHELTPNIIHAVLARTPGAPAGPKGISLFVVPKFLPNADGSLGARNDVHCVSIEHKLGIRASPTAVMLFGEKDGQAYVVTVVDISDTGVTLDANHPLAGEDLTFDIELVEIA